MATWTNNGLTLVATAVQTSGVNVAISFADVAPGCGTLSSAVTSGVGVTSLPLDAGLPAGLTNGQTLIVTDGTNRETVTVNGTPAGGATSIPINSWTPLHNYAAHTTGVAPNPLQTDSGIYNASAAIRIAASPGAAGAAAGESLVSAYFDGTQATALYMTVGFFGGSAATATPGTGTLIGADVQYWNHVLNADSATWQADATI